jgi:hypothetical protein
MPSLYRIVFLAENWSLTKFVSLDDKDLQSLTRFLSVELPDGIIIEALATAKADRLVKDETGFSPAEHAYDVEVDFWGHAKA